MVVKHRTFGWEVISEIKTTTDAKFLVPFVEDETLFQTQDGGVGFFHDRFIFTTDTLTLENVQKIVDKHKKEMAEMIASIIKRDIDDVVEFFKNYLQTYLFESDEDFTNPILDIHKRHTT